MPSDALERREFVMLLGGLAAWPFAVHAKSLKPAIGCLFGGTPDAFSGFAAAFREGLGQSGFMPPHNAALEYSWAENHYDRLPALAADLVRREMAVIATFDTASSLAAKAATAVIPIVFQTGADPIRIGLVDNLARPGGNVTGMSSLINAVGAKRLGLLREIVPAGGTFGLLVDPTNPNTVYETADMQAAADLFRTKLVVAEASTASEIDTAFAKLVHERIDGLLVAAQGFFLGDRGPQLAGLALQYRVPTIYGFRESVLAGGLISYGGSLTEAFRQQGIYAGRILNGERPADLPVRTPIMFESVVNVATANALGLTIPPSVLANAGEIIE